MSHHSRSTRPRRRGLAAGAVTLALTTWCTTVLTGQASALPPDCGVHLYPSLDPSGTFAGGEALDLTTDGIYVGSSQDAIGIERATYWIEGVPHQVPDGLDWGDLLDVTEGHLAVGGGYDPVLGRDRGYVFDIDTGELTFLPGIGGDWAGARRINEHGVAVGDGASANGTGHPLRWRPPYAEAERLPKLGGSAWRSGAWAAGNNDHGDVVGSITQGRLTPDKRDYGGADARFHLPVTHVITWDPQPERLEEAGPQSHAFDVNNAGRAVGFADVDALQRTMPAYWSLDDGQLHLMGSPVPGTDSGIAFGGSESGWATGATETYGESEEDYMLHAFVWVGSGDLRMLPGAGTAWDVTDSIAHGVSDVRDEATGRTAVDGVGRPVVWRCASQIGIEAGEES
jgi:hypothetical protein